MQETQVQSLGQPDPWRREWQPTPVFLPGEFYGQRSLAGYNLLSCKELDMTEQIKHTQGQFYIKKKIHSLASFEKTEYLATSHEYQLVGGEWWLTTSLRKVRLYPVIYNFYHS